MGLCLHNPPTKHWRQGINSDSVSDTGTSSGTGPNTGTRHANTRGGTLVISPVHLALQWVSEIRKFCPTLKVALLDMESDNISNKTINRNWMLEVDIFVITLTSFMTLMRLSDQYVPTFYRIVIDECHDVVSLGSFATNALAQTACDHVWCVTGTPFPHQDASVWGINQLLHIKVSG